MSEFYLNDKNLVPPGGFRYRQAETEFTITAPSWKDLLARVKEHRIANNLPIGLEFDREVERQLAAALPENFVTTVAPDRSPAVPRDSWPIWAKAMAMIATKEDKGLGDVIARTIGPVGGDAFKAWFEKTLKRPCGCAERQESLNAQYPL